MLLYWYQSIQNERFLISNMSHMMFSGVRKLGSYVYLSNGNNSRSITYEIWCWLCSSFVLFLFYVNTLNERVWLFLHFFCFVQCEINVSLFNTAKVMVDVWLVTNTFNHQKFKKLVHQFIFWAMNLISSTLFPISNIFPSSRVKSTQS